MKHLFLYGALFLAGSICVADDGHPLWLRDTPAPIVARLRALHGEILELRKEYPELAELEKENLGRDRPILSYSHNMTNVRPAGDSRGHAAFGDHGCSISVEVIPPKDHGWPGGHGGPAWTTGRVALTDGYTLYYSIGTKNIVLQTTLASAIKRLFQGESTKARWSCAWRTHD